MGLSSPAGNAGASLRSVKSFSKNEPACCVETGFVQSGDRYDVAAKTQIGSEKCGRAQSYCDAPLQTCALKLLRQSQGRLLERPVCREVHKPGDANAARQTTGNSGFYDL